MEARDFFLKVASRIIFAQAIMIHCHELFVQGPDLRGSITLSQIGNNNNAINSG